MVEKERTTADIQEVRDAITDAELVRRPDGGWTLIITINGVVTIDSTRSVGFNGECRMRGWQKGRKIHGSTQLNVDGKFTKKAKKGRRQ
jgi:hypothetical protein